MKLPENRGVSDVFRGYKKRPMAWNGLILVALISLFFSKQNSAKTLDNNKKARRPSTCLDETSKEILRQLKANLNIKICKKTKNKDIKHVSYQQ